MNGRFNINFQVKTNHEILQSEICKLSSEVGSIDKRLEDFETKVQKVIDIAQPQYQYDAVFSIQEPMSVGELPSSADELAEEEVPDQGMTVIAEEEPEDFVASPHERKSSLMSWKSLNVARLTKMGRKSRKLRYPGDKVVH